jgi:rhomboid protease GluP
VALGSKEVLPGGDPYATPPPAEEAPRLVTPVCLVFIALCLVVFGVGFVRPDVRDALVLSGEAVRAGEWWRVLTSAFVHAGILHLGFNLSAVWTLGRALEHIVGSARFLLISFVGTLGASALVLTFNFNSVTVGISGTILAWVGALLPILNPQARRQLAGWLVQVALISLLPGVSWAGHLGGFLFGLPAGFALRLRRFPVVMPIVAFIAAVICVIAVRRAGL